MHKITIVFKKPATVDHIKSLIDHVKSSTGFKGMLLSNMTVPGMKVPKDYRKMLILPEHYDAISEVAHDATDHVYEKRVFQFWNDSDAHKNSVKVIELLK